MSNAGLDEVQAGIKIAERNINNLRYAVSIFLALFIIFQLKISKYDFYHNPELTAKILKHNTP